jgi:hypothetical protein
MSNMTKGITRAEILKQLPKLKAGNFDLFCARAGIVHIGKQPTKRRPHILEYLYPENSVEILKEKIKRG